MHHTKEMPAQPRRRAGLRWVSLVLSMVVLAVLLVVLWGQDQKTALMVTHDVDEAIFLADRIVMMTNGPAATIGEIVEVPFARPRDRAELLEDPRFYELRERVIAFLESQDHRKPPAPKPAEPAPTPAAEPTELVAAE